MGFFKRDDFNAKVKGLFGLHDINTASINCKLIEACCIKDFRSKEKKQFPEWNIQEQGKDWPDVIKKEHAGIINNSLATPSKRKKIKL